MNGHGQKIYEKYFSEKPGGEKHIVEQSVGKKNMGEENMGDTLCVRSPWASKSVDETEVAFVPLFLNFHHDFL